ncbi:hypothetical protein HYFRA_00013661 [Hymenoscyphus fraxineus]|uniref:F-box domain-containing protein n=1 Tax=Hymenoscyphus fraxineus TaxID=746836 RepID=A0A9N9LB83_9HELO|nr:hypothetical protein HYFRA_00013661 [Hymenoscyphus fraxineus]
MRPRPVRKNLRGVKLPKRGSIRPHSSFYVAHRREPQYALFNPQIPPPTDPTRTPILDLPPELLHMILRYLVPSERWIATFSLYRRRSKTNQEDQTPLLQLTQTLIAVRLTNKLFYETASYIYYTTNHFVIGNGPWGSTTNPNLHGLRQFIRTIPSSHRALIRTIRLGLYMHRDPNSLHGYNDTSNPFNPAFSFDISGTISLAGLILTHLTGVQNIRLYIAEPFRNVTRDERWKWFIKQDGWFNFVLLLIRCPSVRKFIVLEKNLHLQRSLWGAIGVALHSFSWTGCKAPMERVSLEVVGY